MPRRQLVLLTGILSVSILASVMTVVWGNEPLLGLDLQGGVSVRLAATEPVTEEMLDQTVSISGTGLTAWGSLNRRSPEPRPG
ncbi:MAG: hypothetical protein CM1200mP26_23690 [Acidimicrobiales bacterium]|nr:MAG: hypothetical protein CM1200mP26_23690 [Acidimicrobiales bacterium]